MKFLVHFVHKYLEFRLPEFQSVCDYFGIECPTFELIADQPFVIIDLESKEDAEKICSRAILVHAIYEFYETQATVDELVSVMESRTDEQAKTFFDNEKSWAFIVKGHGRKISMEEQAEVRERFRFLDLPGPVRLRKPQQEYTIIIDNGVNEDGSPANKLRGVYMGRKVSDGQRCLLDKYTLKKRKFLGPTSMDHEMALIMANMVQAGPGKLLLDPFVGTGSVLVAASAFGGLSFGRDIDSRVLNGKKGRTLFTNFDQYSLQKPDIVRMDNHLRGWRDAPIFHGIVCDPPYGVRAGGRKSGRAGGAREFPVDCKRENLVIHTQQYSGHEMMLDLMEMAAACLVTGGRLVLMLPTTPEFTDEDLPSHPIFEIISNCEQRLTTSYSRRLITMKKLCDYDASKKLEFRDSISTGFKMNGKLFLEEMQNYKNKISPSATPTPTEEKSVE